MLSSQGKIVFNYVRWMLHGCQLDLLWDHFVVYTNIKSCYTPETDIMYSLYLNKKAKLKKKPKKCFTISYN